MCWLFKRKKIVSVEIYEEIDGLDEDDKFVNLAVGDMMDGFDGMVMADLYNSDNSAKTIFLVVYDDGTSELIETENGSSHYYCYMRMVK